MNIQSLYLYILIKIEVWRIKMKIFIKMLLFIIVSILLLHNIENTAYSSPNIFTRKPIKVGVFLVDLTNAFNSDLKTSLEELQKENGNKVQFTIFDGNSNQSIQNDEISKGLNSGFDIFVVGPISSNENEVIGTLNKIVNTKHPLILLFPTTPALTNVINAYPSSVIITGDHEQAGTLEGKIIADE